MWQYRDWLVIFVEAAGDNQQEVNNAGDDQQKANDDGDDAKAGDDEAAAAAAATEAANSRTTDCVTYADTCTAAANSCSGGSDDDVGYLGYKDYMNYLECTKVAGKDKYGANTYFWIRPRCDTSASSISMSIFYDPYCSQYAGGEVNLLDFSGIKFKPTMFSDFYSGPCLDCSESVSVHYSYLPVLMAHVLISL